ncbi:MAG: ornithine carbamoyltransferase [Elusimicrobiota bacterium]
MMKRKDCISLIDWSCNEIQEVMVMTKYLKEKQKAYKKYHPLSGKTLGMIFEKKSTRTRVSFEVGMYQLGGYALYLNAQDTQIGRGETISDTARTLSRFLDGIVIRTYAHSNVIELAKHADIPVINGLSDLVHPCQVLSDLYTMIERFKINPKKDNKKFFNNLKIAYIGDGNNVSNSLVILAGKCGINLAVATPAGYGPNTDIVGNASKEAVQHGGSVIITNDPITAVKDADVVYTDVWVSMGKEGGQSDKKSIFLPFQINSKLISNAKKNCAVMHCLPAHRGEEITDDVMDGSQSIVFDQAENRLHVQKAIMTKLMGR